jgi:hypothetical protein
MRLTLFFIIRLIDAYLLLNIIVISEMIFAASTESGYEVNCHSAVIFNVEFSERIGVAKIIKWGLWHLGPRSRGRFMRPCARP